MKAPNMQQAAATINDPNELLDRIAYRDDLLLKAVRSPKHNIEAEARIMVGWNGTDINRLKEILDGD